MCSHKADIKNSDNTPHITLGTWGLGIDLVGGTWQALPRVRCFPAPAMKTGKIVFQNRKKILPPSEKLNKGDPANASLVWIWRELPCKNQKIWDMFLVVIIRRDVKSGQ